MTKGRWCLFIMGIIFLLVGAFVYLKTDDPLHRAIRAEGRISDLIYRPFGADKAGGEYFPKIAFKTQDEKTVMFTSSNGCKGALCPKIGDRVDIYYDETDPTNFKIGTSSSGWFLSGALMFSGFLLMGLSLIPGKIKKMSVESRLSGFAVPTKSSFQTPINISVPLDVSEVVSAGDVRNN